jgi:quercetin 2,3-dioxygenase
MVGTAEGALPIPGDVKLSRLVSDHAGSYYTYVPLSATRGVYIFALAGEVTCEGTTLGRRDSKGIWGSERLVCLTGPTKTDVIFVETAM